MKVTQTLENGITIHAEGENTIEVFEQLAELTEVFGEPNAVKGGETAPYIFRVRTVGTDKFYELYSAKLKGAKLLYGCSKEAKKLYPKRMKTDNKGKAIKGDDGKGIYLPDRGWVRWNRETGQNE
jgi:hypothetical protein